MGSHMNRSPSDMAISIVAIVASALGCLEATKLRATTKRDKARMALAQLGRASPLQGECKGPESLLSFRSQTA